MSMTLLKFAQSFVRGRLSAEIFSEAYIELWKIDGDLGLLPNDEPVMSECLSTIFCLADLYCPPEYHRMECELDADGLLLKVFECLNEHNFAVELAD
jgi:hypothetical protein